MLPLKNIRATNSLKEQNFLIYFKMNKITSILRISYQRQNKQLIFMKRLNIFIEVNLYFLCADAFQTCQLFKSPLKISGSGFKAFIEFLISQNILIKQELKINCYWNFYTLNFGILVFMNDIHMTCFITIAQYFNIFYLS